MKQFISGCLLAFVLCCQLQAQDSSPTTNAPASSLAAAGQAPDDVLAKLSGLIHAGKYSEAQQLTAALLLAYPDDQRLVKAKTLLDKLVSPQPAAPASPALAQAADTTASNPEPASPPSSPADQLTGMDKVKYNSLIMLGREAQQEADLDQQKQLEQQFMDESGAFLQKHPDQILVWELRAASAISLDDPDAGYQAGQKLLAAGGADSKDPNALNLLSQLNLKGWLDKNKIEDLNYQRSGWVLGTWNVTRNYWVQSLTSYTNGKQKTSKDVGSKEEFLKHGMMIEGYEISGDGVRSSKPDLRGTILTSGEVNWECYLPPSESDGIYVFRRGKFRLTQGRTKQSAGDTQFYPSGWLPVNSFETGSDKRTMSIVIPTQWCDENFAKNICSEIEAAEDQNGPCKKDLKEFFPITLLFTKEGDAQNQQPPPQANQHRSFY